MKTVRDLAKGYKAYTIEMRREFHMNPEPALKEFRTSDRIQEELEKMGIKSNKAGDTGVIAYIDGVKKGKTIGLRADIDALELTEANDVEYKSKVDGMMHGCGHDGHAASLLTAAKILNEMKDQFDGRVKLIFQPGEEVARGAKKLIDEGVMDDVDAIFGIHIWNDLEVGKVSMEAGPRMASAGIFNIKIEGKGGHGSMPHQGVDSVVVGASIVMNMQGVVAREINPLDPAVISFGIFNAGTRGNIIAGTSYLEGTTRCYSMEVNNIFEETIHRISSKTAESFRAKAVLDYEQLVLPVINDEALTVIGREAVKNFVGESELAFCEKTTGGEDFSYYTLEKPGAFAFVGSMNKEKIPHFPHHHPNFDIDEDALEVSSGLYAQFAIEYLKTEGDK